MLNSTPSPAPQFANSGATIGCQSATVSPEPEVYGAIRNLIDKYEKRAQSQEWLSVSGPLSGQRQHGATVRECRSVVKDLKALLPQEETIPSNVAAGLHKCLGREGITNHYDYASRVVGHPVESLADLTQLESQAVRSAALST